MIRTYRYPLYPTAEQEATLLSWLHLTRILYNAALEERRSAWKQERKSVSLYDQMKSLTDIRYENASYTNIPIDVSRGALINLDRSYRAFFRRCKQGRLPGFPRFKGQDRWNSLNFANHFGIDENRVRLPKALGYIKFKRYRSIKGTPKNCSVKREGNKWFINFQCELSNIPKLPISLACGIDLNLESLVVTSDGQKFTNPRVGKKAADHLASLQRSLSRKKRCSKNHRQVKTQLSKAYAKVSNQRLDAHRKLAAILFNQYDLIAHEDLNVQGMLKHKGDGKIINLNKSIHDASWSQFIRCLTLKAENAGKWVIPVDPRNTSKRCSTCGTLVPKTLRDRIHSCPQCGLSMDRDVNAALNILASGREAVGHDCRQDGAFQATTTFRL